MRRQKPDRPVDMDMMASPENLFLAARKARKGKSRRPDVETWWLRRESEITRLSEELSGGSYRPGGYRLFEIREPKRRQIAAAPFGDRVVHHALCNVIAPVLERRFIARSFSCQKGKGTTAARECCRRLTNRSLFALKCDIRKFFPSIDHTILLTKLRELIRCPRLMSVIELIVHGFEAGEGAPMPLFPGDDMIDAVSRGRGLPIGNLTSQLWANLYLDELDHWITEEEAHGAYLRYTDDFLLFGDDKRRLQELRASIEAKLAAVRLRLGIPKSRLLQTKEGVPFCGFRFLPGLRPRILGATKRRFERRRYRLARGKTDYAALSRSVFSWYQFSREANAEGLRRAYLGWPLDSRKKKRKPKS